MQFPSILYFVVRLVRVLKELLYAAASSKILPDEPALLALPDAVVEEAPDAAAVVATEAAVVVVDALAEAVVVP